jgi:hypothetical protein
MPALDALLSRLIDYAGLFPPAGLDMRSAVRAYAAFLRDRHAHLLGSFVLPAGRLSELGAELSALEGDAPAPGAWKISVLVGDDLEGDTRRALEFIRRDERCPDVRLASVELRVMSAADVARAAALVPDTVTMAVEMPWSLDRHERLAVLSAVKDAGRMAKLRAGGVTAEAIPSPVQLAGFIWDCARTGVPFKATAGLHHPVRAEQRLTYAPESPRAVMHGFVNVFLAAAVAWKAAQSSPAVDPPPAVVRILEEREPSAFTIEGAVIRWRGLEVTADDIVRTRGSLARSFGSCSFAEPIADLQALGWLPQS